MAVGIKFISLSLAVTLTSILNVNCAIATSCPHHVTKIPRSYTTTHNSVCYLFVNKEMYWKKARERCWDLGGEMLYIDNQPTMDFIKSKLNSPELSWDRKGVWLGASKVSGRWIWTNGRFMDYSNWAPSQPSNLLGVLSVEDCSQMRQDDGWKWHDIPCGGLNFHYNYVCQFSAVENTATITTTSMTIVPSSSLPPPPPSRAGLYRTRHELNYEEYRRLEDEFLKMLSARGLSVNPSTLHLDSYPTAMGKPGDVAGRVSSSAADQTEDNGNSFILTIIIAVSMSLLLVIGIISLMLYLHQRRSRQKASESAVHFSNNTYHRSTITSTAPANPAPPPIPTSQVPFASNEELYLDPQQNEKHGDHVFNVNFSPKGCSCNHKQMAANKSVCSSLGSDSELGACGGSDPEQELKVPLMGSLSKTNSELVGGSATAITPLHNCLLNGDDYIDMATVVQEKKKGKLTKEEDDKHTYSNVELRDGGVENLYEVLP